MGVGGIVLAGIDAVAREAMLFAAVGFLIGGIDDMAIDLIYLLRRAGVALRLVGADRGRLAGEPAAGGGRFAIFVPAWDERAVIGPMLRHALATLDHPDYRLYVGTYPNDRATIEAVAAVAADDLRVRLVVGSKPGPTTKADCLNTLWRALNRDCAREGAVPRAVVLHDAEDVIDPRELRVFDALIGDYDAVQLPVLPLVNTRSRMVGGHYCDEFAEAHGKQLVVRQALGAALPFAGVGCAIAWPMLDRIARERAGDGAGDRANTAPFDADSLTEDYELGLRIAVLGGRSIFARWRPSPGAPLVVVRAYFPAMIDAAVRQKARWMTGIALAGWDRIGWGRWFHLGEHWMRMRDRRAPLAMLVLVAAYLALATGALSFGGHLLAGDGRGIAIGAPRWLLLVNLVLLGWRLAMRAWFTGAAYGLVEAAWSAPRMVIGNVIAMLAARRAIAQYLALLRGRTLHWDKTAHIFPDAVAGRGRP